MSETFDATILESVAGAPSVGAVASRQPTPSVDILGVKVRAQRLDQAVAAVDAWIDRASPTYVCVTAVHGLVESQADPAFKRILNDAGMVTADGMPLVWLSRRAGHVAERVYGPDLMLAICAGSVGRGLRHFLYGSTDGVLARLAANLTRRFPGLCIAGTLAPPFRPVSQPEDDAIVAQINAARPDIVWVGLGTPKQERWMAAHLGRLSAPVMIGVGAAFDFHAGTKRQAPAWMRDRGLEWLFRLATEPRRLGQRYLVGNTQFLWYLALDRLGLRDFTQAPAQDGAGR